MKKITSILILMLLCSCNFAQESNYKDQMFKSFCDGFENISPVCYIDQNLFLGKISNNYSKQYLGLTDSDLMIDDGSYNYDDDVWVSNWRNREPLYVGKIELPNSVILIYKYLDNINEVGENWISILLSLGYDGEIIDKQVISGYKTLEDDNLDCVFVDKQTFRVFDYKINPEHITISKDANGKTNYITHKDAPWTLCNMTEYHITDNGKIEKTGWTDMKLLNENVTFYREFHDGSDDPKVYYK